MSCKTIPSKRMTVVSATTGGTVYPMTPWQRALGANAARARLVVTEPSSAFKAVPVYQTATSDTDDPDSWTDFSGTALPVTASANEKGTFEVDDLATPTDGKWYVRFGVKAYNSTGTTYESAFVGLEVSVTTD